MSDKTDAAEGETPLWPRCWAYGPSGHRCEQRAGHEQVHTVTAAWEDDECVTPDTFAMARVVGETRTVRPIPIIGIDDPDDDAEDDVDDLDKCAACGWPEAIHAQNKQGCKTFA